MIISKSDHITQNTDTKVQVNIHSFLPLIPVVKTQIIDRYIPNELYNRIDSYTEPSATPSVLTHDDRMLKYLRSAMANLLLAYYLPRAELTIGQDGLTRNENDTHKTAYKYQTSAFYKSYFDAGLMNLEALLNYLSENSEDIAEWHSSPKKTMYDALIIKSGQELAEHFRLKHPSIIYLDIIPVIHDVQVLILPKLIGGEYINTIYSPSLPSPLLHIREYMKRLAVLLSIRAAIPQQLVRLDVDGLLSSNFETSYLDGAPSDGNNITYFLSNLDSNIQAWTDNIKSIIKAFPNTFPPASTPSMSASNAEGIDNSQFKSLFSF